MSPSPVEELYDLAADACTDRDPNGARILTKIVHRRPGMYHLVNVPEQERKHFFIDEEEKRRNYTDRLREGQPWPEGAVYVVTLFPNVPKVLHEWVKPAWDANVYWQKADSLLTYAPQPSEPDPAPSNIPPKSLGQS